MSSWEADGQSSDWLTPTYVFDALGAEYDLDPADHPCSHVPARARLTAGGLETTWSGFVWLNPPYGRRNGLAPWLNKFVAHGSGIALVPDRSSSPWFQKAAPQMSALLFLAPKVKFERPDGSVGAQPGCGSVLMAIGEKGRAALMQGRRLGLLVTPIAEETQWP